MSLLEQNAADIPRRLCYVHVPKCGGQSLSALLRRSYRPEEVCPAVFLRDFRSLTDEAIARYRLFLGHMGVDQARRIGGSMITVVRDPVDRVLSLYYYWKELGGDAGPGPKLVQSMTLEAFLETDSPGIVEDLVNAQTWQLAFDHLSETRERYSILEPQAILDLAKKNLDAMAVVGLCEDMEGTRFLIERHLGIGSGQHVPVINRTKRRMSRKEVAPELERRIKEVLGLDLQLYEHAKRRFSQSLAEASNLQAVG